MAIAETEQGVSVLICTYNGSSRLEPTLNALMQQKNASDIPWEVVLVDNASTDNTSDKARSVWGDRKTPLTIVHEPEPGRDNALRTGFQQVKYEFVCNVDDDTWVCEDYISLVWEIMRQHPEVGVCGGHGEGAFEVDPPPWLKEFETSLAIGPQGNKTGYVDGKRNYLYGACAVYRKSLWNALQQSGFKFFLSGRKGKKLNSGEDFELCQAWKMLGFELYYDERIRFKHWMPAGRLTWPYFRKLYKAFGRSDMIVQQYFKALGVYSKTKSVILDHYFLFLLYELYAVIKKMPAYVIALLFSNTGNRNILLAERELAFFIELFTNKKRFSDVKKALSETHWRENIKIE